VSLSTLLRLVSGMSVIGLGRLVVDVALLALLVHPDCSARLAPSRAHDTARGGGGPPVGRP
jgi:hypothetical protein